MNHLVRDDLLVGLVTASGLAILARGNGGLVGRALGRRPVVFLGSISYSLYLIHFPMLSLIGNVMLARGVGPMARLAVLLVVGSPLILAISYGFHRAFERPYLAGPRTDPRPVGRSTGLGSVPVA